MKCKYLLLVFASMVIGGCCSSKKISERDVMITLPYPVVRDTLKAELPLMAAGTLISYDDILNKEVLKRLPDSVYIVFTGRKSKARLYPKTGRMEMEAKGDSISGMVKIQSEIYSEPWYRKAWNSFVFIGIGWMLGTLAALALIVLAILGRK